MLLRGLHCRLCPALPRCLSGSGVGGRVVRHGNAPPTPTVPQHRLMKAALLRGTSRVGEEIREAEKPIGRLRDKKAGCLAFLRVVLTRERGDGCLVRLPRPPRPLRLAQAAARVCTLHSTLCALHARHEASTTGRPWRRARRETTCSQQSGG